MGGWFAYALLLLIIVVCAVIHPPSPEDLYAACPGKARVVSVDRVNLFSVGSTSVVCSDGRVVYLHD